MLVYSFLITIANTLSRLAGDLPVFEKVFIRSIFILIFALIIAAKSSEPIKPCKSAAIYVFLRGFTNALAVACNLYAIDHMNFADATMLNKLSPLFTVLFCALMLKEKVSLTQYLLIAGAFFSSALVIKPGSAGIKIIPTLIAVAGGLIGGLSVSTVRAADKHGASNTSILLSLGIIPLLIFLPFSLFNFVMPTGKQLLLMSLCGLCCVGAHCGINKAYTYAKAKDISALDYTQMVFATLVSLLLFDQIPDTLSIIGYILIVAFGVGNFMIGRAKD